MTEERIQKLNEIGMEWDVSKEHFFDMNFICFMEYIKENGTADIPSTYITPQGIHLGMWASNMRAEYKSGGMPTERKQQLEEAGMIWDVEEYRWNQTFECLKRFVEEQGTTRIPEDYRAENGIYLRHWVQAQRFKCTTNKKLDPEMQERKIKMEQLGFFMNKVHEQQFDSMYEIAKQYHGEYGNLDVPGTSIYKEKNLGRWVKRLRDSYQKNLVQRTPIIISKDRKERLDETGMIWEKEDSWEHRYRLAKQYYEENGTLDMSQTYVADDNIWLGKWLHLQRMAARETETKKSCQRTDTTS